MLILIRLGQISFHEFKHFRVQTEGLSRPPGDNLTYVSRFECGAITFTLVCPTTS